MVVAAVEFELTERPLPELREFTVIASAEPVAVVEVRVNNLFEVSQPKPDDSEMMLFVPLKKAICPEVPEPEIVELALQVASWLKEFLQRTVEVSAVPLVAKARVPVKDAAEEIVWLFMVLEVAIVVMPVKAPAVETLKAVEEMENVSRAEPMAMVSAVVLSVPMLMVLPAVPVPILMVLALLPVPRLTFPVVPESRVRALAPEALLMVRVPESAILLVVKVCEPITVPVTNEATPAPVTDQFASFNTKSEPEVAPTVMVPPVLLPMVILSATAVVPMLMAVIPVVTPTVIVEPLSEISELPTAVADVNLAIRFVVPETEPPPPNELQVFVAVQPLKFVSVALK